jgi:proteic killer suppression protein
VIRSYRDKLTETIADGSVTKGFPANLVRHAQRRLTMLEAAAILDDLRSPPGNRLEALKGNRAGQYSIRINEQWRTCFVWTDGGPENVEITDYH